MLHRRPHRQTLTVSPSTVPSADAAPVIIDLTTSSATDEVPAPGEHLGWIEPLVDKRVRRTPSRHGEVIGRASAHALARVTETEGVWFRSTFLTKDGQLEGWITGTDVEFRPVI